MLDFNINELCYGCEACRNKCPKGAITMGTGYDGFLYPVINSEKCVKCGLCDKVCPVLNEKKGEKKLIQREAFAIYNKDSEVRRESSSGGLFTVLANEILGDNGVVFGAVFNENMEVIHKYTVDQNGLEPMRGSKYVQSKIGDSFAEVKQKLKENKKVLFTGTSCQVNGLYNFLGSEAENLYTCDVICHGAPSPLVLKKYISFLEQSNKHVVKDYKFRDKTFGWKKFSTKIKYENDIETTEKFNENIYMKGFLKDLYLRNSCYNCKCKGDNILSDITIGDFWGIENKYPEIDDDKGICAVVINTERGKDLLKKVEDKLFIKEVYLDDILEFNPPLVKPVLKNKDRKVFFKKISNGDLDKNIKRYTKEDLYLRIRIKAGKVLRILKLK